MTRLIAGLRGCARAALWLEPLLLALMLLAFWYPTPARLDWLWLLILLVPLAGARLWLHGRVLTRTPLDGWLLAFLILGVINVYAAPYTRGLLMLARPLLGIALYYALVEAARVGRSLRGPVQALTLLALLVGLLAVGATQWGVKAPALKPITDALPTLRGFPGAENGFNPNEIAGALAWLIPLMAALMIDRWQRRRPRWDVTLAFGLLFAALFLGQSRSAFIGVLLTLALMLPLLVRRTCWRAALYAALGAVLLAQVSLAWQRDGTALIQRLSAPAAAVTPAADSPGQPDATPSPTPTVPTINIERSLSARGEIWLSALWIIGDYPLTGVGLSMFRDERVRAAYPVPVMTGRILPHAHNELLQIGADMGLPGLIVYLGLHVTAAGMLWRGWRRGQRALALGVAGGLLAHSIYGLADAITLWDRFAFIFWMLLGLAGALHSQQSSVPNRQSFDDPRTVIF